jgi:hypothetical protein
LSLSWQTRCLLKKAIGDDVSINLVPESEEETYGMASASIRKSLNLVDDELPSREYAKYLAETVLFHLGDIYHLFEKESFMSKVTQFYDSGRHKQPLKGLWPTQLLLVIALGKACLQRGASSLGPPGAAEFLRAVRLQTDVLDLWSDTILHMEILCLTSLYLLFSDMRETAYTFVRVPLP